MASNTEIKEVGAISIEDVDSEVTFINKGN